MTLTRLLPTQNPLGLPVADERRIYAGLFARNADGTVRAGVLPAQPGSLVSGRAEMAYDVAPFVAVTSRSNTGGELVANDAVTRVPTTAAPGANSRIDVIWERSQFPLFGDAASDPVFGVTQGLAAPIPVKPSIPAGALELGTAVITSTTTQASTAVVTSTHPYTATAGGVVLFRNRTDMDAWNAADGSLARDLATGDLYTRVGGAWRSQEGGLRLIIPSSVTGGSIVNGVTQLTSGDTVTINGVFSSKYRRYLVKAFWYNSGGVNGAYAKLSASGVVSSTNYDLQYLSANGASPVAGYLGNQTQFAFVNFSGNSHDATLEITNPAHATTTSFISKAATLPAGISNGTGGHTLPNVYDGIRLELSAKGAGIGFTSGEVAIYGLA